MGVTTTFERVPGSEECHVYGRSSTPTRDRCEALLSAVDGGRSLLYGSGLSAVSAAMVALKPKRVLISGGYHGTHAALRVLRQSRDVEVAGLDETPREGDLAWLETPKNPTGELADIRKYVASPADVVVDATLAPLQRPLDLGARLVVHSATKYLGGHSDVLAGVVAAKEGDPILEDLIATREALGSHAGSFETWLLIRSLRTLELRVARQTATASSLADWLRSQDIVKAVHHDGASPLAPATGVGGVFAVELQTEDQARALPATLTLFKDATSLGGVESLAEWRRRYDDAISPTLVRLSCGIEDPDDLKADFRQAFDKILRGGGAAAAAGGGPSE
mmetsp:Transcript_1986/g.6581  ORF Transcript_1986/g.6581 Transcript_1986/m.6581 type:complete len:336 (-) Transcript_1986:471-1478(-)|eukprot:CAMPEP_0118895596 /NCGR_PEP_ID=MMETSP1166-20130328/3880_1 /TAXON_ID=1104430 /ORGANISM="Chrysoreinhardia sp, Strain CCMP3193" /LENGTH=335 /DNA_ID=CAMNT_0006834641 /DNA_START=219 /DNA_END=1226 /DNA_ORIENTATION=+